MATPVRSGYSDFRQNWKVRKTCCFCFKLIVLMKEQHFEFFRRIRRVFTTFQKINQKNGHACKVRIQRFWSKLKSPQNMLFLLQTHCFDERTTFWMFQKNWKGIFNISKNQPKNGHAGKVRIQRFWSKLKSPQNMLFLLQTDCFDERTKFWMFQKNSKGILNIWKTQPKKSTNKMATPVRSGYSDFRQNWKVRKTCYFCFKLIVLMKEQNFECFRRIRRVFSTFEKLNKKNQPTKWPRR